MFIFGHPAVIEFQVLLCTKFYQNRMFLPRDAMHSADYTVARCLSVHPFVCLSVTRRYYVETVVHIFQLFFHRGVAISFWSFHTKWYGIECNGLWKNRDFRSISRFISEIIQDRATGKANSNPCPSFRVVPFSMTEQPETQILAHAIIQRWISQKRYKIQTQLHRNTNMDFRPSQECHFEWPWVILSDLAKYSVTQSIARSLCDSWASCYDMFL